MFKIVIRDREGFVFLAAFVMIFTNILLQLTLGKKEQKKDSLSTVIK